MSKMGVSQGTTVRPSCIENAGNSVDLTLHNQSSIRQLNSEVSRNQVEDDGPTEDNERVIVESPDDDEVSDDVESPKDNEVFDDFESPKDDEGSVSEEKEEQYEDGEFNKDDEKQFEVVLTEHNIDELCEEVFVDDEQYENGGSNENEVKQFEMVSTEECVDGLSDDDECNEGEEERCEDGRSNESDKKSCEDGVDKQYDNSLCEENNGGQYEDVGSNNCDEKQNENVKCKEFNEGQGDMFHDSSTGVWEDVCDKGDDTNGGYKKQCEDDAMMDECNKEHCIDTGSIQSNQEHCGNVKSNKDEGEQCESNEGYEERYDKVLSTSYDEVINNDEIGSVNTAETSRAINDQDEQIYEVIMVEEINPDNSIQPVTGNQDYLLQQEISHLDRENLILHFSVHNSSDTIENDNDDYDDAEFYSERVRSSGSQRDNLSTIFFNADAGSPIQSYVGDENTREFQTDFVSAGVSVPEETNIEDHGGVDQDALDVQNNTVNSELSLQTNVNNSCSINHYDPNCQDEEMSVNPTPIVTPPFQSNLKREITDAQLCVERDSEACTTLNWNSSKLQMNASKAGPSTHPDAEARGVMSHNFSPEGEIKREGERPSTETDTEAYGDMNQNDLEFQSDIADAVPSDQRFSNSSQMNTPRDKRVCEAGVSADRSPELLRVELSSPGAKSLKRFGTPNLDNGGGQSPLKQYRRDEN